MKSFLIAIIFAETIGIVVLAFDGPRMGTAEEWTAAFTGLLFISTTGLWVFTWKLWATTAATADAIVNNERPWVGLLTIALKPPMRGGAPIDAVVLIHNVGRSPALEMRANIKGYILPSGTDPEKPNALEVPAKALFPTVSDRHRPFLLYGNLSTDEVADLEFGAKVAWIVGRIEYVGGWTNLCARWDRIEREFAPSDEGNDAA